MYISHLPGKLGHSNGAEWQGEIPILLQVCKKILLQVSLHFFINPLSTPIPRTVPSDIFQAKAMLEVLIISSSLLISTFCQNVCFTGFAGVGLVLCVCCPHWDCIRHNRVWSEWLWLWWGWLQFEIATQNMTGIMMMPTMIEGIHVMIAGMKLWRRMQPATAFVLANLLCCVMTMLRRWWEWWQWQWWWWWWCSSCMMTMR